MKQWECKEAIAVLGAAARFTEAQILSGFRVGLEIARQNRNLVTGATLGVPYAAAIGAKLGGAVVVGLSPAASREEHIGRYRMPLNYLDVVVYTGMGLEGRNPLNVRSAKGAIFIAGEFGTLSEFSAAWTTGNNVLGVLEGVGGISSYIQEITLRVQTDYGSLVLYDSDPENLVRRVCGEVDRRSGLTDHAEAAGGNGGDVMTIVREYLEGNPTCIKLEAGKL